MKEILSFLQDHTKEILADVEHLVRIESPSRDQQALNRVMDAAQSRWQEHGKIDRKASDVGDILHIQIPGESADRVLLLAHMDTVYPTGSWTTPWRIEGDLAYGPGVYDMKGGVAQALWALRALRTRGLKPAWSLDLLLTPDEEIGSEAALPLMQQLARGARAVFVLEAPYMNGDLKIARKGVGDYRILIHGTAAHQGVEPEKGRNAIVSAALLIGQMIELQDLDKGTTLGPNVIRGGTVSNVVADEVILDVDLRVWSLPEAERVDAALRRLKPLDGTRYEIRGSLNRPPMEPTTGSLKLFEKARGLAERIGFTVGAARVGGGSDGNFTAQLAPTLDGFGAMGAHAHQKDLEYIHIPSLAPRTALLAGMLLGDV